MNKDEIEKWYEEALATIPLEELLRDWTYRDRVYTETFFIPLQRKPVVYTPVSHQLTP